MHDQNFKNLILDYPRQALAFFAAEEAGDDLAAARIVPVVIFLRPGTRPDQLRLGGDRHIYIDFRYLACDLYRISARDHLESDFIDFYAHLSDDEVRRRGSAPIKGL